MRNPEKTDTIWKIFKISDKYFLDPSVKILKNSSIAKAKLHINRKNPKVKSNNG